MHTSTHANKQTKIYRARNRNEYWQTCTLCVCLIRENAGLFCKNTGLFCKYTGLFGKNTGLFLKNTGLFSGDIGLVIKI